MEETRSQREDLGLKLTEARANSKKIIFWTAVRCVLVFVILLAGVRGNPLSAPVSFLAGIIGVSIMLMPVIFALWYLTHWKDFWHRFMIRSRKKWLCIICCLSCLLSGCVALPGQESFGEKTYSDEKAQTVYEDISSSMAKIDFEDWNGFSISSSLYNSGFDIYKTEEYTVAYCEMHHNDYFIWNDGRLYSYTNDEVLYRNMNWDEIVTESFVMERWEIVCQLLERKDVELTYKHIPMADNQNLLKAKYPETEISGQKIHSAELLFYLNENGEYDEVTLHCVKEGENEMSISFFPYEGSTDVQAERKLWSFGYDAGLLDRVVPALSQQEEHREWSREIIDSIDFSSLMQGAEYAEDLTFPDLTTLLAEMAELKSSKEVR